MFKLVKWLMRIDYDSFWLKDATTTLSRIEVEFRNIFRGFSQNREIRIIPFLLIPDQVVSEFLHRFVAEILNPEKILKIDLWFPGKSCQFRVPARAVWIFRIWCGCGSYFACRMDWVTWLVFFSSWKKIITKCFMDLGHWSELITFESLLSSCGRHRSWLKPKTKPP